MRWAICDDKGLVSNVVLWDGVDEWGSMVAEANEGLALVLLDDDSPVGPGDRINEAGQIVERNATTLVLMLDGEPVTRGEMVAALSGLIDGLVDNGTLDAKAADQMRDSLPIVAADVEPVEDAGPVVVDNGH